MDQKNTRDVSLRLLFDDGLINSKTKFYGTVSESLWHIWVPNYQIMYASRHTASKRITMAFAIITNEKKMSTTTKTETQLLRTIPRLNTNFLNNADRHPLLTT